MTDQHELSYDRLRKSFAPELLKQSAEKSAEEQSIIGQKRALAALKFGLEHLYFWSEWNWQDDSCENVLATNRAYTVKTTRLVLCE